MSVSFGKDLALHIKAGYPIIDIVSAEEDRVLERVDEVRRDTRLWQQPRQLFVWTISRGWLTPEGQPAGRDDTMPPERALAFAAAFDKPALFVLKDFHPYLEDKYREASLVVRLLRDLAPRLQATGKTLIWVSPVLRIPPELEKDVTVLDLPMPEESEYRAVLEDYIRRYKDQKRIVFDLDEAGKDRLVKACQGLTKCEAENALAKAIVGRGRLGPEDVTAILAEKEQIIRKSGILEYMASVENFGSIGGLGSLKDWLQQRDKAFTQRARDFGLPHPRGVLLVGVPGCGKSLAAKAVAAEWKKPLVKFDLGRVFASLVGETEERMRRALAVAEGVAPAVLWIDELEKGLSGLGGGGDGGVASRVFGNLLTWMEEKQKPVFVVATANDIGRLPPELLRKGRLDEIFFVDLPNARERAEILMIHLARRQRDPAQFDLPALVHRTEGFNGAELAEVITNGLFAAFAERAEDPKLESRHLLRAVEEIVPLSRSRADDIDRLRQWAAQNCRPAARPPEETAPASPRGESLIEKQARMLDLG
jgi:DNA polymerase III delta prime subunit